ncbi:MAG TPA: flagellar hook protein FlgE [Gemmatimonas aurantiaca]|uniref:Flagellar hook protein FlgE n=2 Tax=Gemmatimonas aurantiaca TaxID=173480 RepID=C1A555_GEMAT|nr:flagellar hook protein FlgE [Gemmatimonas aurantiaca]BAH37365.1 flagellar hook protein FlgE [Gemmatimonas aurantiaca T-27]HCT55781.1 flagellar hook protein FlgE [Gemmatimonas aurantiaca]
MLRSLYAGVSGLRNNQVRMDVIGNNIANVNTVAFKAGRVTFKEGFAQLLAGASRPPGDQGGINPIQIGLGMQIGSIDQIFNQGNLETTGLNTDIAIQGDSFFVVRKGNQSFYTRAGNFQVDALGQLVSPANGFIVQGRMYENGQLQDGIQDIRLPFGQKVSANPTTDMKLAGNLNASAPVFQGDFNDPMDRALPINEKAWTETQIGVFDSQGTKHDVKLQMWKTGPNSWDWRIDPIASAQTFEVETDGNSPPSDIPLPTPPAGYEVLPDNVRVYSATGVEYNNPADYSFSAGPPPAVQFTANMPVNSQIKIGYFMSPDSATPSENSGTFTFDNAGLLNTNISASLNFAVPGANPVRIDLTLGGGVNGLTQFASTSSTAVLRDQNGYTAGTLQNFSIDRFGLITGFFTNGTTSPLARIVLADFNNPSGLLRIGDNMYQESANSGGAVLGFALEGSQSQMTSGALEMSNVDLAQEFTNMIVAQRGFQANGKVVSTSDEMLQELMTIKR